MIAMRFDAPPEAGDKKLAEKTVVITRMESLSAFGIHLVILSVASLRAESKDL